jgi:hypothetical protein
LNISSIPLTQGKFAWVDDEDLDKVSSVNWHYDGRYAANKTRQRKLYMHHLIISKPGKGYVVDHINRNPLDNRRANLRIITRRENQYNSGLWRHNKSGHKGVSWSEERQKWVAAMGRKGLRKRFNTFEEAVKARKEAENERVHY